MSRRKRAMKFEQGHILGSDVGDMCPAILRGLTCPSEPSI